MDQKDFQIHFSRRAEDTDLHLIFVQHFGQNRSKQGRSHLERPLSQIRPLESSRDPLWATPIADLLSSILSGATLSDPCRRLARKTAAMLKKPAMLKKTAMLKKPAMLKNNQFDQKNPLTAPTCSGIFIQFTINF